MISASAASRRAGDPSADRAVVLLRGALDAAATQALRDRLTGILDRGPRLLILDLSGVLSCDPAGLAVLIAIQRRARLFGTTVCLTAPALPVANLLHSTGLDRRFTIHPDLSSALASGTTQPAPAPPAAAIAGPGHVGPARDRKRLNPRPSPAANRPQSAARSSSIMTCSTGGTNGGPAARSLLSNRTQRRIR